MQNRIHVVDAASLLSLQGRPDVEACLIGMTTVLRNYCLCFPNELIEELERLAAKEPVLVWAKASTDGRCHKGADFAYTRLVLEKCPDLADKSAAYSQEPSAPYVASQALELSSNGSDAIVVTEDILEKPTRQSLMQACETLQLPHQRLDDFLDENGIP